MDGGDDQRALIARMAAQIDGLTAAIASFTGAKTPSFTGTLSDLKYQFAASWPADATWRVSHAATLAPAAAHFGERPAYTLTRAEWISFRDKVRAKQKTLRKAFPEATTLNWEMTLWRKAHRWAVDVGLLLANPLEGIKPLRAKKHRKTEPTPTDVEALRPFLDAEGWAYVLLGFRRGLRAVECRRLEWPNIDLATGRVRFLEAKTREFVEVTVPSDVVEALRAIRPDVPGRFVFPSRKGSNRPCNATTLWRKFRDAADAAELPAAPGDRRVVFHDTRHGFTSGMARRVPLPVTMRMSRHKSLRSAARYIHVNDEDLADAQKALESSARRPPQVNPERAHSVRKTNTFPAKGTVTHK